MLGSAAAEARNPEEACEDGVQNGPETDVDCGGDCLPCWHRKHCNLPADCASGLCADGRCHERILLPGAQIPAGYEARPSRRDAAGTARIAGLAFLATSFGASYVAAASYPSVLGALYLPVLGPWLSLSHVDSPGARFALATDGSLQLAGSILLIGGFALAGRQLLRLPPPPPSPEYAAKNSAPRIQGLFVTGGGTAPFGVTMAGTF